MPTSYIKKDETTLSVVKPVETVEETQDYKLDFLKKQELSILVDLNSYVAKRKEELAEVRTLIAEAENLGIKTEDEAKLAEVEAKLAEDEAKLAEETAKEEAIVLEVVEPVVEEPAVEEPAVEPVVEEVTTK